MTKLRNSRDTGLDSRLVRSNRLYLLLLFALTWSTAQGQQVHQTTHRTSATSTSSTNSGSSSARSEALPQGTTKWNKVVMDHQYHNITGHLPRLEPNGQRNTVYHPALHWGHGSRIVDVRKRGTFTRIISQHRLARDTVYVPAHLGTCPAVRPGMRVVKWHARERYIRQQAQGLLDAHNREAEVKAYIHLYKSKP